MLASDLFHGPMANVVNQSSSSPTVVTDKPDYAPGATALFTARDFEVGSTLRFDIRDDPTDPGDDGDADIYQPLFVTDGSQLDLDGQLNGQVVAEWQVPIWADPAVAPDALNATLLMNVTGSGNDGAFGTADDQVASTTFTDAVIDVSVGDFTPVISERSVDFNFGSAIDLDGTNDTVNLGDAPFDSMTAITIEAWFKVDNFDTASQTILSKGVLWGLERNGSTNQVQFNLSGFELNSVTNVNDGKWHHVAGVWSGSPLFGSMRLYVDGVQEDFLYLPGSMPTNNFDALIGDNAEHPGRHFDGQIDEVRIWGIGRSANQIKQSLEATLTGAEPGLIAYYQFDDSTATDQSGNGIDGTLNGSPSFVDSYSLSFVGYVELNLSAPVSTTPGIIVEYSLTGDATVGTDYYSSQLDISTTDGVAPINGLFIAEGESKGRIYISALPDAIDEAAETITVTLQADANRFGVGTGYQIVGLSTANISIRDGETHNAELLVTDVFGESNDVTGIVPDASGAADFWVQLASEPTSSVTVNVSPANGTASSPTLLFDDTNWEIKQKVTISGLAGLMNGDKVVNAISSVQLTTTTSDLNYSPAIENIGIHDLADAVKIIVEEGGTQAPITPTVSIHATFDATEGQIAPGVATVSLDVPAPAGGVRVFYSLTDDSKLGSEYSLIDDGIQAPNVRYVDIDAGTVTATILLDAIDDDIADGTVPVELNLVADAAYNIHPVDDDATVNVLDNDIAAIEMATLTNIASLDTIFETGVIVDDLLDIEITSYTSSASGATATISVALKQLPSTSVMLTLTDANSVSNQVLTFEPGDYDTIQTATLTLAQAADTGLDIVATTDANGDGTYNSLNIALPLRQLAVTIDANTLISTTEAGAGFSFGVRLASEPTQAVTVDLDSQDVGEGLLSTSLNFNASNWNVYQVVSVASVDDSLDDGDQEYEIALSTTTAEPNYTSAINSLFLVNQDNEDGIDTNVDTANGSDIIATLSPVIHTMTEAPGGPGQFEITLSEPAPQGGLTVGYVVFERTATAADIDIATFVERSVDGNPLAIAHFEDTEESPFNNGLSIGDLDNDGDLDVLQSLLGGFGTNDTRLFENIGTAEFPEFVENTLVNPLDGLSGAGTAIGDVDTDGDIDIIMLSSTTGPIRYFENQLIGDTFSFIEQIGASNPFDGLTFSSANSPQLVDIDGDGQLELFVSRYNFTTEFFENVGGSYIAEPSNPLAGLGVGNFENFNFPDWDQDGDFDMFVGSGSGIRYFENIGTKTASQFVERTGALNPANGITGSSQYPAVADINNNGALDLFVTDFFDFGEVGGSSDIRYFEAARYQEVFVAEGLSSLIVNIPVINDVVDEADENFEVALISALPQSYDIEATAAFDNQYDLTVTAALAAGQVEVEMDISTSENIFYSVITAGTVLAFSGGTEVTVVSDTVIDVIEGTTALGVTLNVGTTIDIGETATTTYDDTLTIDVTNNYDGSTVGLSLGFFEVIRNFPLTAGMTLTFSNGTEVTVDSDTVVEAFSNTQVPVTYVSGPATITGSESVDLAVPICEVPMIADDPDINFLGLSADEQLVFSDGSVFNVLFQEVIPNRLSGDFDASGTTDSSDLAAWEGSFGMTGPALPGDGDNDDDADGFDFLLWQLGFGTTEPLASGVPVAGYLTTGSTVTSNATTTLDEPGYRVAANLLVTGAFDGSNVSLQIDETAFPAFSLPAGTVLQFSGGAIVTVDIDAAINNTSGTLVPVTLTSDSVFGTIDASETSSTSDFFSGVDLILTDDIISDGFMYIKINNPSISSYTLLTGTLLTFETSGGVVEVLNGATLNNVTDTEVEVVKHVTSPVDLDEILANDTTDVDSFTSLSSTELTIVDNDDAGVTLTETGLVTSESDVAASQSIDVVLNTEPKSDVFVYLGVDATEALLSDNNDDIDVNVVELLFTPLNWNVTQTVDVQGVDDQVDDGNVNFTVKTTVVSTDIEYTDDTVAIQPFIDFNPGLDFPRLQIDELLVLDTIVPVGTYLTFNNGAVYLTAAINHTLFNSSPVELVSSLTSSIDSIGLNYTATVYDGDERTNLDVTTDYNSGPGTIGLQIAAGSGISAATFKKGKTFTFSNGTEATLEADVSLNNSSETVATISLKAGSGTAIPDTEITFFEENLIVTQAYDGTDNNIGLRVDDELISSITFVATTDLEFSNGAVAALDISDTFTNSSEFIADVTLDTTTMTTKATTYYEEKLVADLIFTNNDDDVLGITATQTDPDRAIAEGNSNNFFSVVLDSQPTAPVEITLAPSDDNIQLINEFAGESHRITFDLTNWNIPQAIEVTAVDDSLLEYDHLSTISFSVSSTDLGYNAVAVPNDVEVFIQDDELPAANVQAVAGAIEANTPGYFVITLDEPAPSGYDDTGIEVTYVVTGTADSDGIFPVTDDVQTITGTALIAPGLTTSQLIAFPIDDFKTEGIDLKVTANYVQSDSDITLQINVLPFKVGPDDDASNGTIDLLLDSPEPMETTILSKGTKLLFNGTTTAIVNQTVIIKENVATSVSITLSGLNGDIVTNGAAFQEVNLPSGTELKFENGTVVTTSASANVSNETNTVVAASLTQGTALSITSGTAEANTTLQGESVIVTLTSDAGSGYRVGNADSASLIILDNDKPGVRIADVGDATTVAEGETSSQFFVSLLSEPASPVTINLSELQTTRTLALEQGYSVGATSISMKVDDTNVDSLLLPMGDYLFDGKTVHVSNDITIFSGKFTDVAVTSLVSALLIADTANYNYQELAITPGEDILVFDSSNWFQLKAVTVAGLDDVVVEDGNFHFSDIDVSISTTDPNYKNLSVADHSIQIVDRRFDTENTRQALNEGFLALQDSIENLTLPIIGKFGDVAPPFIKNFLGTLSDELRETENLTVESLTEAFNTAINTGIGIDTFSVEVTDITSNGIAFLLDFSDSLMTSVALNSDFGLEALNLNIESTGTLDLFVDYGVSLGFGINSTDGFYIDTTTTGFNVAASLDLSDDFSATGELGFIQLNIADGVAPVPIIVTSAYTDGDPNIELKIDDPSIDSFTLELDTVITFDTSGFSVTVGADTEISNTTGTAVPVSASEGSTGLNDTSTVGDVDGTGIGASFVVTLVDANDTNGDSTQLTLSEIAASRNGSPFSFINYAFTGGAALDLDVSTSVSGNAAFPSFSFNLFSNLPLFNYGNEAEAGGVGGAFDLAFNDITLDMGGFVTDLLGPIVSSINDVIEPFQPIIEVLTTEIELFSKIGIQDAFDQNDDGKATLIEVALTLAGGLKNGNTQAKFTKFIDAVTGVIELTQSLSDLEASIAGGNSLAINFGSYVLDGFKGASENEDATTVDPASGMTGGLDMNADSQTGTTGNSKVGKFFNKLNDLGITLDVIENPLNVIKIFLGQDIDLVTWDVPVLDLSFSIEKSFPVFAGISGVLGGEINVYSDLVFGFDTVGFTQWKEKDFAIEDAYLIFDGFYLSDIDPDTGEDVDELTLEATIFAGAKASAVIASITAVGGITGTAGLDLIDIGEYTGESDGRIRGSEIVSRISTPLELFEIAGQVDAFLRVTVKIGIDLGFWSIEKTVYEKELARVTLFEFTIGGGSGGGSPAIASSVVDTLGGKGSIQATEEFSSSITNSNSFELDSSAPELADETNLVPVPATPSLNRIDDEAANFEIAQIYSELSEDNQVAAEPMIASAVWPLTFANGSVLSDFASNRKQEEVASERSTHERIFSELNRSYDERHHFDRLWSDYNRISGAAIELLAQRKSESSEDENSQRQTLDIVLSGLEQDDYHLG